jgi:hypothetical protein
MMSELLVGDKDKFAIESYISEAFDRLSFRALGYFVLHIRGCEFGVRSTNATLLANSFDGVLRRIKNRGQHTMPLSLDISAAELAGLVREGLYDESPGKNFKDDFQIENFVKELIGRNVIFAPDGDAAFDDGSHVLQVDKVDCVWLVGFKNLGMANEDIASLVELKINPDDFYGVLQEWCNKFELSWKAALKDNLQR